MSEVTDIQKRLSDKGQWFTPAEIAQRFEDYLTAFLAEARGECRYVVSGDKAYGSCDDLSCEYVADLDKFCRRCGGKIVESGD